MDLAVKREVFKLKQAFTISRGSRTEAQVLTVSIHDGVYWGWGECVPYARYGETLDSVNAQIQSLPSEFDHQNLYLLVLAVMRLTALCGIWRQSNPTEGFGSSLAFPLPAQRLRLTHCLSTRPK